MNQSDQNSTNKSYVVMSYDFEMRWGVHQLYGMNLDGYRTNLENCRPVVVETLKLLAQRNLKATWATVGALGLNNWEEYFRIAPSPPAYQNQALAFRPEYADLDPQGLIHFAPDLIQKIVATPGQDLGSHSFSHLYFREPGVLQKDFLDDTFAVEKIFKERFGVMPESYVFPCNQSAFLESMNQTSIKMWRQTEPAWFYDCTTKQTNTRIPRILRLIDSINPYVTRASFLMPNTSRASLFVRFNLPEIAWRLQLKRIENELKMIKPSHVFHLWWHPHNVGYNLKDGSRRLTQVLDIIAKATEQNHVYSSNMKEVFEIQRTLAC